MSVVALFGSIAFGLLTIMPPAASDGAITMAFLLAAFAPKALQKFAEAQFPPKGVS